MVMLLCFWGNFVIITNQDPNKEDYSRVVESFPIRYHFPCYPASSQHWTFFPTQSKTNPGWVYWTKPLWIHTVGAVGCAQSWTDDWFVKPHIHCTLRWPLQMPFWSSCISQGPQGFKCRSSWFELIRVVEDFSWLEGFTILKSDLHLNNQTARWTWYKNYLIINFKNQVLALKLSSTGSERKNFLEHVLSLSLALLLVDL